VYESYFNGYDADMLHDIASVTKSWTSALVGIAQAQGALTDLDAALPTLLPDYFVDDLYADKREITLRDLLMMRSGIEYDEYLLDSGDYGSPEDLLNSDLTTLALAFPVAYPSGEAWNYSTLDTQLISAIVQHAVGQPLSEFIVPNLFEPMGIEAFEWLTILGTTVGGQNLSMTPRDMAKLGLLYMHNGLWDGEQIVPSEWVEQSLTPQNTEAFYPPTDQNEIIEWYAYQWWTWKPDWNYGYRSFQAKGYAGQQVYVFPELNLIIVTTANLDDVDPDTAGQQEAGIGQIVTEIIFPALTDVELN
jgi:CubicO group peptidase (beta-lactamase class C family)